MPSLRWLAITAAATLLLLELMLQTLAVAVSVVHRPDPVPTASGGVLCIGDSFTHGVSASDAQHSYPAQLEQVLRERHGLDLAVNNAGIPGQNSRDVIARLDAWLERCHPSIVCVLIGANDSWTQPAPWEGTAGSEGFVLRWRTGRLLAWLFGEKNDWTKSGDAAVPRGTPPPQPTEAMLELAWTLFEKHGIERRAPATPRPSDPEPAAVHAAAGAAWKLLQVKDHERALALLQPVVAQYPDSGALLPPVVFATAALDQAEATRAVIESMWRIHERAPSFDHATQLRECLRTGRDARAVAFATEAIARYPDLTLGWNVIADHELVTGNLEAAASAYERTLQLLPEWAENQRPWLARSLGRTVIDREPSRGVELVVAGALMLNDMSLALIDLRVTKSDASRRALRDLLERPGLDAHVRDQLQRVHDEVFVAASQQHLGVLEQHLRGMARMAAARGARMVILTYPFSDPSLENVQRRVAASCAGFADVRVRFDRELLHRPRTDLFAGDGHCNDAGYALMAEVVAAVVAELLEKRS
jgi:lysophospholipase L1-like esterase